MTPNKKSVQIEVDKKGCEFLIEELTDLLNNNKNIVEYDSDTGYNCGILTKESLGVIGVPRAAAVGIFNFLYKTRY